MRKGFQAPSPDSVSGSVALVAVVFLGQGAWNSANSTSPRSAAATAAGSLLRTTFTSAPPPFTTLARQKVGAQVTKAAFPSASSLTSITTWTWFGGCEHTANGSGMA